MMCRSTLLHLGQLKVRKSWPNALGSIAVSFIGESQATQHGPGFVNRAKVAPLRRLRLIVMPACASPSVRRERYTLSHRWMPKRGGDATSMLSRVPKPLVNIAHIRKINE
jgi:hypothetical protein